MNVTGELFFSTINKYDLNLLKLLNVTNNIEKIQRNIIQYHRNAISKIHTGNLQTSYQVTSLNKGERERGTEKKGKREERS